MTTYSKLSMLTLFALSIFISIESSGACCINPLNPTSSDTPLGSSYALFLNDGCLATANGYVKFGSISTFAYDTTTCSFAAGSNFALNFQPLFGSLAFLPNCNLLLAADYARSTLRVFEVANCQLTEITPAIKVTPNPRSVAVSPDGSCVAVLSATVLQLYCVSPTCNYLPLCDTMTFTGLNLSNLAFAPASSGCNFLVLTTQGNTIIQVPYTPATCTLGTPNSVAITGATSTFALAFAPNGDCLAVSDTASNVLYLFSINACDLTLLQTISSNGTVPRSIAYTADNACLAVANSAVVPNITIFPVNSDCTLGSKSQVLSAPNPYSLAFSPQPSNCNLLAAASDSLTNGLLIFRSCAAPVLTISQTCKGKICSDGKTTYKITVSNTGTANATQVTVTDILPSCLTFKQASGANWQFTNAGQTVTAVLALLEPGQEASFEIIAKARCCSGQTITNQASVVSNEITTPVVSTCSSVVE